MSTVLTPAAVEGFITEYLLPTFHRGSPIRQHHRDMIADFCDPHPNVADAYPRGHAKSTTINLGCSLAAAILRFDPFQLKISRTRPVCIEFLRSVKFQLSSNEKLIEDFGILPQKEWEMDTEDDFICSFDDGYQIRMVAFGCEQPMRGMNWKTMRPSLVICDDMEDDEQVLSPDRREKVTNWFLGTLLPIGTADTKFRVVGTILHAESLLQTLLDSPEWKSRRVEACDAEVSEGSILWPEQMPREKLLKLKKMYESKRNLIKFNMEYRNIALDMSSGYFQRNDFAQSTEEERSQQRRWAKYVGVDYAISTKERADFTCMVVGALDDDGFLHVLDVRRGRWDGKEIIDEMFAIQEAFQPEQWFVESGAIQKALGPALAIEQRQRGMYLNLFPMVPDKDKHRRATGIQARMRSRSVKFDHRDGWFSAFEEELLQFPRGRHDDQVDAFAWLGIGLENMVRPKTEEEEEAEILQFARKQARQSHDNGGRSRVTGY